MTPIGDQVRRGTAATRTAAAYAHVHGPIIVIGALLAGCGESGPPGWISRPDAPITVVADAPLPDGPLVEPFAAVSPIDSDHVVIGVIAPSLDREGPWHCAAITTLDGGHTWSRHDFDQLQRCIDPWVVIHPDGSVLLTALEIRRDSVDEGRFRLNAFRSTDRGRTWTTADTLGRGFEHPILHLDGDRTLVLARTMTRDGGGLLRHSVFVGDLGDRGAVTRIGQSRPPATGPDTTEITPTGLARLADGRLAATATGAGRAWALRSADDGATWPEVFAVSGDCAGGGAEDEFAGWPFLAADPGAERLYHACIRAGFAGVEIRRSEDGGRSWSEPAWLGTGIGAEASGGTGPHARTAMIAVNRDGVVGAAWYDRGLDPDRACQDVFFSASTDGGLTFSDPLRVTTATSCPRDGSNDWVAESWTAGGDYSSLAAAPDGTFRLVWADSRSGRFALRTAVLDPSPEARGSVGPSPSANVRRSTAESPAR